MISNNNSVRKIKSPGLRTLLTLACIVIIIVGLKLGREIFVPILMAFFLTVISSPLTIWLKKLRIPGFFAVLITLIVDIILIGLLVILFVNFIEDFQSEAGKYIKKIEYFLDALAHRIDDKGWLAKVGIDKNAREFFLGYFQFNDLVRYVTQSALINRIFGYMKSFLIILFIMSFMIVEVTNFGRKIIKIYKTQGPNLKGLVKSSRDIQHYLIIKTISSLITGLCAGILISIFGEDFAFLWGITAFALNFIPAVGSIMAAVPPVLIAFINGLPDIAVSDSSDSFMTIFSNIELKNAIGILLGYLVINITIGNFLEPMLLGHRFGISTLFIIISLFFWGWLWGAAGMFLSVPMTMLIKVLIDNNSDLRWVSFAMEKNKPRKTLIQKKIIGKKNIEKISTKLKEEIT